MARRLIWIAVAVVALYLVSALSPIVAAAPTISTASATTGWASDVAQVADNSSLFDNASVAAVAAAGTTIVNTPSVYDWPMFMHDTSRSGQVLSPAPFTNHQLSSGKVRGIVANALVAADNYVYVEAPKIIYAKNASTLSTVWSLSIRNQITSAPAVMGSSVYFGDSAGVMHSVSALTGAAQWVYQTGGAIHSSPLVDSSAGMVFFGSNDGNVYALTTSGTLVWKFSTGSPVKTSPSVSGGVLAVGSDNGKLYFLNEANGALDRTFTAGGPIESSPAFEGGLVYFGSNDTNVYAVNAASATKAWSYATGGAVIASPAVDPTTGDVFVGSLDGNMYALSSGTVVWKDPTGPVVASADLGLGVTKNLLPTYDALTYVSSLGTSTVPGVIYAIESDTGTVEWQLSLAGEIRASAALAWTRIYIGDSTGALYDFGALRFSTSEGTFTAAGVYQTSFSASSGTIVFGTDTAWGKYGVGEALLTVKDPSGNYVPGLINATMTFYPAQTPNYNWYYSWTYSGKATGTYSVLVMVEDAHSKISSNNPRCCGFTDFKTTFTLS